MRFRRLPLTSKGDNKQTKERKKEREEDDRYEHTKEKDTAGARGIGQGNFIHTCTLAFNWEKRAKSARKHCIAHNFEA